MARHFPFFPWWRRAARAWRLGLVLLALSGLAWMAWLGALAWLQASLEREASAQLGRRVRVAALSGSPVSLSLELQGLTVAHTDGQSTQLQIGHIRLALDPASLWARAPVLRSLDIDSPHLELARQRDGRLDLADVLARLAEPAPTGPRPRWEIRQLRVAKGSLDWQDHVAGSHHRLVGLELSCAQLSTLLRPEEALAEPHLRFDLDGGQVDIQAQLHPFVPQPRLAAQIKLQVPNLGVWARDLAALAPLVPASGRLSAELSVQLDPAHLQGLELKGGLNLRELGLQDRSGATVLRLQELQLPVREARPLALHGSLGDVRVKGLSGQGDWRPAPATAPTARTQGGAAGVGSAALSHLHLAWNSLNAEDWHAEFRGGRAGPPWTLDIGHIRIGPALWQSDGASPLRLSLGPARVADLRFTPGRSPSGLGWDSLELERLDYDAAARSLQLGALSWLHPRLQAQRDASGRWMWQDWLARLTQTPGPAVAMPGMGQGAASRSSPSPLRWSLGPWRVQAGSLGLVDQAVPDARGAALRLELSQLQLETGPMDLAEPNTPVALSGSWASRHEGEDLDERARWRLTGRVDARALRAELDLALQDLPLHEVLRYVNIVSPLSLAHGRLSGAGRMHLSWPAEAPDLHWLGDVRLSQVRLQPPATAGEGDGQEASPLEWDELDLRALALDIAPNQALGLAVQESRWSGLMARLSLDAKGQLNWQKWLRPTATPAQPATENPSTSALEAADAGAARPSAKAPTSPAAVPGAGPAAAPGANRPVASRPPVLQIGPTRLGQARIVFEDRFIQPPFKVDLSELTASLGAFSSADAQNPQAMAVLQLNGLAQGHALLDVQGSLHPLAHPLRLDVRAHLTGMDLPALSPYARKFAGYGIDQGVLNLDVHYRVLPNGELQASNQLVLGDVRLGPRDTQSAADWPVKLAMALLADADGVIHIDLPIEGSLDNPDFKLGPLITKLLGELLKKALTAPFSLLAYALAGDAPRDTLSFEPGRAQATASSQAQLDELARVLQDRTALHLTLTGHASRALDQAAWQRERLAELLRRWEQRQPTRPAPLTAPRSGQAAPQSASPGASGNEPAWSDQALRQLWRETLGLRPAAAWDWEREPSELEMREQLLAAQIMTPADLRALADARSRLVREHLRQRGLADARMTVAPSVITWDEAASQANHVRLALGLH